MSSNGIAHQNQNTIKRCFPRDSILKQPRIVQQVTEIWGILKIVLPFQFITPDEMPSYFYGLNLRPVKIKI